ncbi:Uncharacterized conserved protein, MAPEG superfamily [Fontimonas thermophila]|uniref:Uncharacterized conserved protein, MAPEG superfamily n=1 Tax=Fontimonas thermophila TaxID=1076937 RepID=A0A1I2H880_9GAMM|nr:MAPEG family protein [Fontimonas thermophila]SFF25629.1 Uncharacterized conserved protein, MAPEG superfamily [Fontimonas thermophila]
MSIAYWCVVIAAFLPFLGTLAAKIGGRMPVSANHNPREWLDQIGGWQKRAHWYQLNSFEAFPAFAAAVLIATELQAPQARIDQLAMAFIGFRLAYFVCYVADWATLRSLVWFGGIACTLWLFLLGA